MVAPLIEFKNVSKKFDGKTVISDLNLGIMPGELFVLVGSSGSGKTTTLKMINRLLEKSSGTITVAGRGIEDYSLTDLRWQIGYVLQQIALFPTMTVAKNVSVVPDMQRVSGRKVRGLVDNLLAEVGLDASFRNRMPIELSGGQQQRVGIIRALAGKPPIILMDEPFSALDPLARESLQKLILKLHTKYQNTIVFVTHDMDEALKLGDRIGIMKNGKLLQVDTPKEITNNPANKFVADFFSNNRYSDLNKVLVNQIIEAGFMAPRQIDEKVRAAPSVEQLSNLKEVLRLLASSPLVKIIDARGKPIGCFDNESIIRFLSTI
ncbi:ABC transporter ATP-binding protein [Lentilactobacillus kisonensis]|uniref:ABC-type quaternary amine transporter n=2 Tax=Lentilactobacillus kisonensis TaxID=481722 RepID=H1LIR6_9LACO|nr:ABC transporter ATP-binding protein [Lentilactobacillus kisonensis]EHO49545.1 ABC transporter, ATP-binding protein [Lentilactobacillus kisonensis F0435]KRL20787.1 ABC transporter, ATP-binding protein [Lentilactobacillus kisonensis DSM 19906 = JCM 15041]